MVLEKYENEKKTRTASTEAPARKKYQFRTRKIIKICILKNWKKKVNQYIGIIL
jgi:hypothetical protein